MQYTPETGQRNVRERGRTEAFYNWKHESRRVSVRTEGKEMEMGENWKTGHWGRG